MKIISLPTGRIGSIIGSIRINIDDIVSFAGSEGKDTVIQMRDGRTVSVPVSLARIDQALYDLDRNTVFEYVPREGSDEG